jgi:hypothetical protein
MSDVTNHVRLSPSGLLIEIETRERGDLIGAVQIDRHAWPAVVANVDACILEDTVGAQIHTIVEDAAAEEYED